MRIAICLLSFFFLVSAAYGQTESWQQLKKQSEELRDSDPVYALFKLQKAWDLLANSSPELASKELRKDVEITYGRLEPKAEENCHKLTEERFQAHMNNSRNLDQWQSWKISKKNNAFYLTAPESALDERSGCASGLISAEESAAKDPQKRKELDAYYARESARLKEKVALLPVVISSSNSKYQDLLALSGDLEDGKDKAVTFDINAFVPKQFRRINWP